MKKVTLLAWIRTIRLLIKHRFNLEKVKKEQESSKEISPGKETVLLVDDDAYFRHELKDYLTKDFKVFTARSTKEAKRKIEKNFLQKYDFEGSSFGWPRPRVEVWSWVTRKYFYVWAWDWQKSEWGPRGELRDPTMHDREMDEEF